MIIRLTAIAAICGLLVLQAGGQKASRKSTDDGRARATVSFKKNVVPIFKTYCLPCHTEDQMNPSELYLESYEELMKGGKHGSPVIAGNPDSSLLIRKISFKPPFGDPMPLKVKTPFNSDTLNILRKWITQGAKNN